MIPRHFQLTPDELERIHYAGPFPHPDRRRKDRRERPTMRRLRNLSSDQLVAITCAAAAVAVIALMTWGGV